MSRHETLTAELLGSSSEGCC